MTELPASSGLTSLVVDLLESIELRNRAAIGSAADACLATIRGGGLIHVGGSGHGLSLVMETFYRAGGLACINPIWEPDLLPLSGARASTLRERTPGVGARLVDRAGVQAGETVVVFSQSGTNPLPVELALQAHTLGATAIAVTSRTHADAVARAGSRRLVDICDIVVDTGVAAGDASFDIGVGNVRTAAFSTIAGVHAWNLVLVALIERARAAGVELPVWVSSNVAGGDARIAELLAAYGDRIPAL